MPQHTWQWWNGSDWIDQDVRVTKALEDAVLRGDDQVTVPVPVGTEAIDYLFILKGSRVQQHAVATPNRRRPLRRVPAVTTPGVPQQQGQPVSRSHPRSFYLSTSARTSPNAMQSSIQAFDRASLAKTTTKLTSRQGTTAVLEHCGMGGDTVVATTVEPDEAFLNYATGSRRLAPSLRVHVPPSAPPKGAAVAVLEYNTAARAWVPVAPITSPATTAAPSADAVLTTRAPNRVHPQVRASMQPAGLTLATYNVWFAKENQAERFRALLAILLPGATTTRWPDCIALQEMTARTAVLLMDAPSVQEHYYITDSTRILRECWYGVITLVKKPTGTPRAGQQLCSARYYSFSAQQYTGTGARVPGQSRQGRGMLVVTLPTQASAVPIAVGNIHAESPVRIPWRCKMVTRYSTTYGTHGARWPRHDMSRLFPQVPGNLNTGARHAQLKLCCDALEATCAQLDMCLSRQCGGAGNSAWFLMGDFNLCSALEDGAITEAGAVDLWPVNVKLQHRFSFCNATSGFEMCFAPFGAGGKTRLESSYEADPAIDYHFVFVNTTFF